MSSIIQYVNVESQTGHGCVIVTTVTVLSNCMFRDKKVNYSDKFVYTKPRSANEKKHEYECKPFIYKRK